MDSFENKIDFLQAVKSLYGRKCVKERAGNRVQSYYKPGCEDDSEGLQALGECCSQGRTGQAEVG